MKVLFISTWFPYPLDSGSKIRVYHLLHALAERHQVRLISFVAPGQDVGCTRALQEWGVEVDGVQRDPFRRDGLGRILGYLSLRPRDVVATYSPEMARLLRQADTEGRYEVVVASATNAASYAAGMATVPRVFEEHNFMTGWMEEGYRSASSPAAKLHAWITWRKCLRYERWLYPHFDACAMVSERDRSALLTAMPGYRGTVEVVPNGVDVQRNRPGGAEPCPNSLIFNGALTYYANADAVRFFLGEVMPLMRARQPDVTLKITGRTDGVDLRQFPLDGNVTLTDYLDDIRPAVAGSWACVVPLRLGAGTRLKILESLALGTPVIATSKGAEGLEVTPEQDILIADRPEQFAHQTLRLLQDAGLRRRLSENGRRLVEARYDWLAIGKRFVTLVEATADAWRGRR